MLRRLLAPALLLAVLTACSKAPDAAPPVAVEPAPSAAPATEATAAPASPADAGASATASTASVATAAPATVDAAPAAPPAAPPAAAAGPEPRLGTDYFVLSVPVALWSTAPKLEIAEVFSYRCIHCAEFQPKVNAWHARMPADARWEYVPGVFGGSWDDFARAFFAAEVLGVRERTHDNVFHGVFEDKYIATGSQDEIAAMYARWGVNKAQFLDTMRSFGVTAKLNRAKQFAVKSGVDATPTIIVNGKYRVAVTSDRGFDGMLSTVEWLLARERSAAAGG